MFKEYALDPGLLTNWQALRYFSEKFGWSCGRLLCEYPKRWKRMVYEAISNETWVNRQRMEERLRRIDDRLVRRRGTAFDDALAVDDSLWARNAIERHNDLPFQAIITGDHGLQESQVIIADDLDENHPLMRVASGVVPRNAEQFAEAASLLLKTGTELVLVDPYLDMGELRWQNTLAALLATATESTYRDIQPVVKIHSGIGGGHGKDRGIINRRIAEFRRQSEHFLPRLVPNNLHVDVFLWLSCEGGEQFHNRYLMSEHAGLGLGTGLDEARLVENSGEGPTDDWFRLTPEQYNKRWQQFQPESCPFESLCRFSLSGTV